MPRSMVTNTTEIQNRAIKGIIQSKMIRLGLKTKDLAVKIHMPESTMYLRMRNPDTFQVGELRRICTALKFTEEEKEQFAREAM